MTVLCQNIVAQNIQRIDPPFWFKEMKNPHLQILVQMDELVSDLKSVSASDSFINRTLQFKQLKNKKFFVVDFDIPAGLKLNSVTFKALYPLKKKDKTFEFTYILKEKNVTEPIDGVGPEDFIYLLMPDRFSNGDPSNDNNTKLTEPTSDRKGLKTRHGGDIQGIINHLDYMQILGVTALWPTPLVENDQPQESYHGYAITDHYNIDSRFGSNALYGKLKTESEKHEIKLIKDVIYNHVGNNHYLFKEKPSEDWFHHWDTFTRTNYKATTLIDPYAAESDKKAFQDGWFDHHMPDLNQKNPELANYLIQNTIWWIENFKLNGLRIDTYSYPDQEFMKRLIKEVLNEYPTIGVFGEVWVQGTPLQAYFVQKNPCLQENPYLPGVTDFQVYSALTHALTNDFGWTEGVARIYHTLADDQMYYDPFQNVLFLDNHDLSRFYSIVGEDIDKLKIAIGFMLTSRGIPSLYYGTEILMKNFSNPDALVREDFPGGWPKDSVNKFYHAGRTVKENEIFDYVMTLANYRKQSSVLQTGKLKQFIPQKGVYVYFRYNGKNEKVMVIINQTNDVQSFKTERFSEIIDKTMKGRDVVSKKNYTFENNFSIGPKSILILEINAQ